MGTIYETGVDQFLPTPFSKALKDPLFSDGFPILQDVVGSPLNKIHESLSRHQWKNPEDSMDCPFQLGHDTKNHFFQWMHEHPKLDTKFNNHMSGSRTGLSNWTEKEYYPLEENLLKGSSEKGDAIFFVDVGGGNGHDLKQVCRNYPNINKRMILQDQASVMNKLGDVKFDPRIQPMTHDFFQEQPVKGEPNAFTTDIQ